MNIKKTRKWDENIAKLIMFSVTIIIAVWLVGIIMHFYQKHKQYEVNVSYFWNTQIWPNQLNKVETITWCTTTPHYVITEDKYWVKWCNSDWLKDLIWIYDVKVVWDKIYYKIWKN